MAYCLKAANSLLCRDHGYQTGHRSPTPWLTGKLSDGWMLVFCYNQQCVLSRGIEYAEVLNLKMLHFTGKVSNFS